MMSLRRVANHLSPYCGTLTSLPTPGASSLVGVGALRHCSALGKKAPDRGPKKAERPPRRVVFISQSTDVFSNLAFEDWLYKNWSFAKRNVLFLWRNSPCVVIGRHQNPHVEANLQYLESAGVPVARRSSGGGSVYHDEGNLNCTFFTTRDRYDRKENLEVINRALREDFGMQAKANERDDVVIGDGYKVSGSAAKLGRAVAYHHCTLLVRTDKQQLSLALQGDKSIQSKATPSVPAMVMNLSDANKNISVEQLIASIGSKYLCTSLMGKESSSQQTFQQSNGFTLINPSDDWFPGLGKLKAELSSNTWLHNKTPRFTITRSITLPECVAHNTTVSITVQAYHGEIEDVRVATQGICPDVEDLILEVGRAVKGSQFTVEIFREIANRMRLPQTLRTQRSVM